jgi:hypothetical protein
VALSSDGNTLAVGAHTKTATPRAWAATRPTTPPGNSGAVYVFTKSGAGWSQQAYVKASNTAANDSFGISVALSADGSTLAAGADGEDSNATGINGDGANNSASNAGAVYVY